MTARGIPRFAFIALSVSTAYCGRSVAQSSDVVAAPRANGEGVSKPVEYGRIDVRVTHIPTVKGKLVVALYDSATFLKKGAALATAKTKVDATAMHVFLEHVARGRYAVVVYHDENGNDALDTNLLGIPTEAYGFSRDARGTFGPPSFEDAAFDFSGKTATVDVDLR
ncbi:MAG: DUF2141 domain-containing protein [Polyangiales bacterium]